MRNTRLDGMAFWCLVGGVTVLYPHICLCIMRYFYTDVPRARSSQRSVLKDSDTSDMADLNVTWRIFSSLWWWLVSSHWLWKIRQEDSLVLLWYSVQKCVLEARVDNKGEQSVPVDRLIGRSGFIYYFGIVKYSASNSIQEVISLDSGLMWNYDTFCGGRRGLRICVRY